VADQLSRHLADFGKVVAESARPTLLPAQFSNVRSRRGLQLGAPPPCSSCRSGAGLPMSFPASVATALTRLVPAVNMRSHSLPFARNEYDCRRRRALYLIVDPTDSIRVNGPGNSRKGSGNHMGTGALVPPLTVPSPDRIRESSRNSRRECGIKLEIRHSVMIGQFSNQGGPSSDP